METVPQGIAEVICLDQFREAYKDLAAHQEPKRAWHVDSLVRYWRIRIDPERSDTLRSQARREFYGS